MMKQIWRTIIQRKLVAPKQEMKGKNTQNDENVKVNPLSNEVVEAKETNMVVQLNNK